MTTSNSVYEKKTLRQHIYDNTDTYAGGSDLITEEKFIYLIDDIDSVTNKPLIYKKEIHYIPAIMSLFNEILVNARDQKIRIDSINKEGKKQNCTPVTNIKVNFNTETGEITIYNDGDGFEVFKHDTYKDKSGKKIWTPELVLANLLTSSNYDKTNKESGVVGGKNGYGAKLVNIFSDKLCVETVDAYRHKLYRQEYRNNMTIIDKPSVKITKKKPYTIISWILDFKRFGITNYSKDMIALMIKRVYDIAGCTDGDFKVFINDKNIKINNFQQYVNLYKPVTPNYLKIDAKWECIVSLSQSDKFEQCSFVNGIETSRGGKHVDYIVKQITKNIAEYLKKKHKKDISENYIKNYINIHLNCIIEFPSFDSQMKELLITPASKFGSKPIVCPKFCKKYSDSGLGELVLKFAEFKESNKSKSNNGKKTLKIRGLPKLDDANDAGGKNSSKCILILTEGDSAKSMAISGLSEVGRDRYGVYPLRGKMLNVKEASTKQIIENSEITALKKILGLQDGMKYKDINKLRYGKIMVMTDQDHDGSHIKGLLINIFHTLWPSLLEKNFITSMITPIVKVNKGKKLISFYNLGDYKEWKILNGECKGWNIKYYKGLGTSNSKEAKEYFSDIRDVTYTWNGDESEKSMMLAFKKEQSDSRKSWLKKYNPETHVNLDIKGKNVHVEEFINRELILFSNDDTSRSIPSCIDGLKPSQRKILYCCFKRKLTSEIRVAQLAGYVSEHGAYHHGEASLLTTIVGMAQNYTGKNNINLLKPNGQFGTRILGGDDSASARYIHTELNIPIVDKLFPKKDMPILNFTNDDGYYIEPVYYVPLLPMILINGGKGIGTGFSTSIPQYNPIDIANNIKRKLKDLDALETIPWFNGFTGKIIKKNDVSFITKGTYHKIGDDKICVTELPVGYWTQDFKNLLEILSGYDIEDKKKSKVTKSKSNSKTKYNKDIQKKEAIILDYRDNSDECKVNVTITFKEFVLEDLEEIVDKDGINGVEKVLKLITTKKTNLNNMHLYNHKGSIQKYSNINEIIDEFYNVRMDLYTKRKEYILNILENELKKVNAKVQFIKGIIEDKIIINKQSKKSIIEQLYKYQFPLIYTEKSIEHIIDLTNDNLTNDNNLLSDSKLEKLYKSTKYDYLIKLPIDSLTIEKLDELERLNKEITMELDELKSKTEKDTYLEELNDFIKSYKNMVKLQTID